MPNNILFICHTSGDGGGERVMVESVRQLSQKYKIFIASPADGHNGLKKLLRGLDIFEIREFKFRVARNKTILFFRNILYGVLCGLFPLLYYIKKRKVDLIYVNSSVNIIGILVAIISRKEFIIHIHEQSNEYHIWVPYWTRHFYTWVFRLSKCHLIFVSNYTRLKWELFLKHEISGSYSIIYPPFVPPIINNSKNNKRTDSFTFGYLGSLQDNKNVESIINCFDRFTDCKLVIGGDGPSRKRLEGLTLNFSNIFFKGRIENVGDFFSVIDVLIIPSYNESWGLVALEAISCGIPVIITIESGLSDFLEDFKHVLFISPNKLDTLIRAMQIIKSDSQLYENMASLAIKRINELHFNQQYTKNLLNLISKTFEN